MNKASQLRSNAMSKASALRSKATGQASMMRDSFTPASTRKPPVSLGLSMAPPPQRTPEPVEPEGTYVPPPQLGADPRRMPLPVQTDDSYDVKPIDPRAKALGSTQPIAQPTLGTGTTTTLPETSATQEAIDAARAQNVSTEGLTANALDVTDRANQYGLHLIGGVGDWNDFHMYGTSVDVTNYQPGQGFTETPEMRAFADEMVELGRSGALGPDGKPLVAYVVYAGKRAGINTNWEWVPVTQPDDITQGHWDHVHVSTDNAH